MPENESEFKDFFLGIYLNGVEEPRRYRVSLADFQRGMKALDSAKAHASTTRRFFCFDTLDGLWVAVSLQDVDLIDFFWQPVMHSLLSPEPDEEDDFVDIGDGELYFRGRPKPHTLTTETAEDLAVLSVVIDSEEFTPQDPFLVYVDEDGETSAVNTTHVILVELPLAVIEEGRAEQDEREELA